MTTYLQDFCNKKVQILDFRAVYLYVSLVGVHRACKLSLLANCFSKYHDLFEEEDSHLPELVVRATIWILCTQQGAS